MHTFLNVLITLLVIYFCVCAYKPGSKVWFKVFLLGMIVYQSVCLYGLLRHIL